MNDSAVLLQGEIRCKSLLEFKGLKNHAFEVMHTFGPRRSIFPEILMVLVIGKVLITAMKQHTAVL